MARIGIRLGQGRPGAYIRNPLFVAGDDDFFIPRNLQAIFGPSRNGAPRTIADVDHFAHTGGANGARNFAERADDVGIGRLERLLVRLQPAQKQTQQNRAGQADQNGDSQIGPITERRMAG